LSLFTLCIGCMFAYLRRPRLWSAATALIASILITATRHNALLLAFPAFFMVGQCIADRLSPDNKMRYRMILVAICVALLCLSLSFEWAVNKRNKLRSHLWYQSLLWDVAAISIAEEQMLIPDALRKPDPAGSMARLMYRFSYYSSDPLFFYKDSPLILWQPGDTNLPLDKVWACWRKAVLTHPADYLRHRLLYIVHLLNIPDMAADYAGLTYYRIDSEFTPIPNQSKLFERMRHHWFYQALALGVPFRGWFYVGLFLLSVIGLPLKRDNPNACLWCLWFSGGAYFASFVVIGSGAVMRYLVVYAILGPAILAGRRLTTRPLPEDDAR